MNSADPNFLDLFDFFFPLVGPDANLQAGAPTTLPELAREFRSRTDAWSKRYFDGRTDRSPSFKFCATLEIALSIGYIRKEIGDEFRHQIMHFVGSSETREYWQGIYLNRLIWALVERLSDWKDLQTEANDQQDEIFHAFLALGTVVDSDPDLDTFVRLFIEEADVEVLETVRKTWTSPNLFQHAFERPEEKRSRAEKAFHGSIVHLNFLLAFDRFLLECPDPGLRSRMWEYHFPFRDETFSKILQFYRTLLTDLYDVTSTLKAEEYHEALGSYGELVELDFDELSADVNASLLSIQETETILTRILSSDYSLTPTSPIGTPGVAGPATIDMNRFA